MRGSKVGISPVGAGLLDRNGWLLHQDDTTFATFDARQWQPSVRADYFPTARQQLSLAFQWVGIRARADEYYELAPGSTSLQLLPVVPDPVDDFSLSQLSFQVRYRWQIAPLSDLFVVYTKGDSGRGPLAEFSDLLHDSWKFPLGDQFVVKLRYRVGS